jgi:hypothetical protein
MEEGKKLTGAVYCSSLFKYKDNKFSANFVDVPKCLRELWADDIICGFGIRSVKTGSVVLFELKATTSDDTGGFQTFTFVPSEISLLKNPVLADIEAEILFEGN